MRDLFSNTQNKNIDPIYDKIRSGNSSWRCNVIELLNEQFKQYYQFLDHDFHQKIPRDFINCLWELKLAGWLANNSSVVLEKNSGSNQKSRPDFCFLINKQRFYLEATVTSAGKPNINPRLNANLDEQSNKIEPLLNDELRQRILSAFTDKSIKKYENKINEENGNKKSGYEEIIRDDGYIIAISTANISPEHIQVPDTHFLSCFFPFDPEPILELSNPPTTRYPYQPSFEKNSSKAKINTAYFSNPQFSHVSAVLISCELKILLPDISNNDCDIPYILSPLLFDENDFILIHNPFAKTPLTKDLFNVKHEYIATINNQEISITDLKSPR